jgi:HSP20 family protein
MVRELLLRALLTARRKEDSKMKPLMTLPGRRHSRGGPGGLSKLFDGWTGRRNKASLPDAYSIADRWPSLDLSEDDKQVVVELEAPGLSEKDLRLTYEEGVLYIQGEKKEEREETRKGVRYRESRYGSFSRSVPVDIAVDWDQAKAEYKRGVLKVVIPKKSGRAGRKFIPVD